MSHPLLSVIIPTRGRSHSLSRAVASALKSAPDGDVEVIVVPNGPESDWRTEMKGFSSDKRVHVCPIKTGHACVARNHGLGLAKGRYTRFLDDDDILFSNSARDQLRYIEETGAEVCSGRLQHMDSALQCLGPVRFTEHRDFVSAACEVSGFTLPTGNIFLTSALNGAAWNESVPRIQDYVWMIQLASLREWHWIQFEADVGAWVHHDGDRISSTAVRQALPHWVMDSLISLYEQLSADGRINEERRVVIANALWRVAHGHFPMFPFQCHRYAQRALQIDPTSRQPGYQTVAGLSLPPLLVEWLTIPKRYVKLSVQSARQHISGEKAFRNL